MERSRISIDLNALPVVEPGTIISPTEDPIPPPPPPPPPAATAAASSSVQMGVQQRCNPNARPETVPEPPVHPMYIAIVNDLREQIYRVSVQREELRLERIRLREMLSSLQQRAEQLARENEALRKKLEEVSAFFR